MKKTNDYSDLSFSHIKNKKVMVRFPNESFFFEMEINMDKFKPKSEFDDQVFGWYDDIYISLKKN